jgi:hypothetical protein
VRVVQGILRLRAVMLRSQTTPRPAIAPKFAGLASKHAAMCHAVDSEPIGRARRRVTVEPTAPPAGP